MKAVIIMAFTLILPQFAQSGTIDSLPRKMFASAVKKPEIFTFGFIDIINTGQINASARFIRILIGEPGKIVIPLSFYSGVSANSFQNPATLQRSNDVLVTNYINPLSGIANISFDGQLFFDKKKPKLTKPGVLYHFGERVLTGVRTGLINDPSVGKPVNFLNSFAAMGIYFQTGAWEKTDAKNVGLFWLAFRMIGCYSNAKVIKQFLPKVETNGFYYGYSFASGIEISNVVTLKMVFYKYLKKPEIDYYLPIYQFSFNYSLKK